MMDRKKIFILIQKYLDGLLSDSETADLESRLAKEPELMEELKSQQLERQVMDELVARELKERMRQWDTQLPNTSPSFFKKGLRPLWLASLLLLLAAAALFWFFQKNINTQETAPAQEQETPAPAVAGQEPANLPAQEIDTKPPSQLPAPKNQPAYREIAQKQYDPLRAITLNLKGTGTSPDAIDEAMQSADQAYQQGDLEKAIQQTLPVVAGNPNISRLQLILGKLYFENGEYEKAIGVLKPISEKPTVHASEAQWNLLLAYLARYESHKNECRKLLGEILSDPSHFGYKKAQELQEASAQWK